MGPEHGIETESDLLEGETAADVKHLAEKIDIPSEVLVGRIMRVGEDLDYETVVYGPAKDWGDEAYEPTLGGSPD